MADSMDQQQVYAAQASEIAWNTVAGMNIQPSSHRVTRVDTDDTWTFTFLPLGRVRGGGVQVTISRTDLSVKKIVHLQ